MIRKSFLAVVVSQMLLATAGAQVPGSHPGGTPPVQLTDQKQKVSYLIGQNIGKSLKELKGNIDPEIVVRGLRDGLNDVKPPMTEQEIEQVMRAFQAQMQAEEAKGAQVAGQKNKQEGDVFLAANAKQPGVTTQPSGLQYKVLKQGNGPSPKATDTVTTHYTGKLLDGTVFDSSVQRGQPASFPVNRVIKGWIEALQLMKVGDKWELFIPPELAYGAQGQPGIPPNSVLVFEVELLGIQ